MLIEQTYAYNSLRRSVQLRRDGQGMLEMDRLEDRLKECREAWILCLKVVMVSLTSARSA